MNEHARRIVIVGGGTSGWMAAIALSSHFPEKQITVVDPSAAGPIGVGEGVTGVVQQFVSHPGHGLGIEPFFRETDATLKLGIWYRNWRGEDDEYLAPLDSPSSFFERPYFQDLEDFYALLTANGRRIGDEQIQGRLMRAGLTDYRRQDDGRISRDMSSASCHFDAVKFAAWLRRVASGRSNVTHVDDTVTDFSQDAVTGTVTDVRTREGREVPGDFFLDCTGFARQLFAKAYAPRWVDLSRFIKVDSAIPAFAPRESEGPIGVETSATALAHGWMWRIPTQSRDGQGYVFSSRYVDDEQAVAEFRAAGGHVGDSPRIIRFQPGKFATQWEGNVCAIGMAGGFLEPLEASTIHIMYVQITALTELFMPYYCPAAAPALAQQYNELINTMYDDVVDFISCHYHTGRMDTPFWREYQQDDAITETNHARLAKWKYTYPVREDFTGVRTARFALGTGIVLWMPMLCGLGLLRKLAAEEMVRRSTLIAQGRANLARYLQAREFLQERAISHREAIAYLRGDGNTNTGSGPKLGWTIDTGLGGP